MRARHREGQGRGHRHRRSATPCARSRQGGGAKVDSAVDGLKLLAQGKEINYEGASGPCDFTEIGDILDCKIRFEQAQGAKFKRREADLTCSAESPQLLVNGLVAGTHARGAGHRLHRDLRGAALPQLHHRLPRHHRRLRRLRRQRRPSAGRRAAAVVVAFLVAGAVGVANDDLVLRPLRPAGALTTAIGAIALTIVLENVVRFVFGNDLRGYDLPLRRDWQLVGAMRIGPQQVENLGHRGRGHGRRLPVPAPSPAWARRCAPSPTTPRWPASRASTPTASPGSPTSAAWGWPASAACCSASTPASIPLTGFRVILSVFAAAVVGGLGSIPGAVVGALTIGVAEELSLLSLAPAYRTAVGFVAILLVLTLRPRGLLGERAF